MIRLLSCNHDPSVDDRRLLVSAGMSFAVAAVTAISCLPLALSSSRNVAEAGIVAFSYVLLVAAFGLATFWLSSFFQPAEFQQRHASFLKSVAGVMLWTAPSFILLLSTGVLGLLAFGAFSAALGRCFKKVPSCETQDHTSIGLFLALDFASDYDVFDLRAPIVKPFRLAGLVCLAYAGIAAELAGNKALAVVVTAVSWFTSAWILSGRSSEIRISKRNYVLKLLTHATFSVAASFLLLLTSAQPPRSMPMGTGAVKNKNDGPSSDLLHSSIILFDKQRVIPTVVPPQKSSPVRVIRTLSTSVTIPFSGEYWFFRWPLLRPPPTSIKAEGNPTMFEMNVRGFGGLQMHARQSLVQPISIRCCGSINVVLNVADEQPAAVQMELTLIDSTRRPHNSQTLGKRLLAEPNMSLPGSQVESPTETFEFKMPLSPEINVFDSLDVWFHLEHPRAGRSAAVSVARFELTP